MYTYHNCPICKGQDFTKFISCKDHTLSQEHFTIVNCSSCGFKFTNPIPEFSDLGKYYKSEDYISHSNTKQGFISKVYHLVRAYTLRKKLNLVLRHVSKGSILDYGTGTGMFLKECKGNGWDTYGLEPDSGAREIANGFDLSVKENKTELHKQHPDLKYDAITLWHVLEHVTDLNETLQFFSNRLKSSGVLIVAVPNYTSYDAKIYKEYWAAYDVPRHLYHFNVSSLTKLLHSFGFSLIETKAMKFDSYYVSLLSEKYKRGKINYFKAFLNGFISNSKAKKAEDYSSVIYVFKHNKA